MPTQLIATWRLNITLNNREFECVYYILTILSPTSRRSPAHQVVSCVLLKKIKILFVCTREHYAIILITMFIR